MASGFFERFHEWLGGRPLPEPPPQPSLDDLFTPAPQNLAAAIQSAGGDPQQLVKWFDCDMGAVFRFAVAGSDAVAGWRSLRSAFEATRMWPAILGPSDSVRCHNDLLAPNADGSEPASPREILRIADEVDIDAWQTDRNLRATAFDPEYRRPYDGKWPDPSQVEVQSEFYSPLYSLSGKPHERVWLGLFAVTHSWEVPAIVRYGDWNDVPAPELHVAMHRRWHAEFGAELVSLKHDTQEFQVAHPPRTRDSALALAELQYDYCPDIVDQGVGSIEALATSLVNAPIWYFWWD